MEIVVDGVVGDEDAAAAKGKAGGGEGSGDGGGSGSEGEGRGCEDGATTDTLAQCTCLVYMREWAEPEAVV